MGNQIPKIVQEKFDDYQIDQIKQNFEKLAITDVNTDAQGVRYYAERVKENIPALKYIDKETFIGHCGLSDFPELGERLFQAFDADKNAKLDFAEFSTGLAVLSKGKNVDKWEFIFNIFDINGRGYITKDEMKQILSNTFFNASKVLRIAGDPTKPTGKTLDMLVEDAFTTCDLNHNGHLEKKEFCLWAASSYYVHVLVKNLQGLEYKNAGWNKLQGPTQVQHKHHLGASNVPEIFKLFSDVGVTEAELENPETVQFLLTTLFDYISGKKNNETPVPDTVAKQPTAIVDYPYTANGNEELSLVLQDTIKVVQQDTSGWWYGYSNYLNKHGWFPSDYVKLVSELPPPPPPPSNEEKKKTEEQPPRKEGTVATPAAPATAATPATPAATAATPSPPPPPAVKQQTSGASLMDQIHAGAKLKKPAERPAMNVNPSKMNILSAIEEGVKLKHVTKSQLIADHLKTVNEAEKGDIKNILERAINSHRMVLRQEEEQQPEDDSGWEEWE